MTAGGYRIVPYQQEHEGQVVQLQKALWSPYEDLNRAYLNWKHVRNPYTSQPLIYLAVLGPRVVGMRGFFGAKWQFGSPQQVFLAPCASDMVVAEAHRNRGLVTTIMRAALQDLATRGFAYTLSLSASSITLLSQISMGWRSIGSMQPAESSIVDRRPLQDARMLLKKSAAAVLAYQHMRRFGRLARRAIPLRPSPRHFDGLDARGPRLGRRLEKLVSVERAPRPQEMAGLISRLHRDDRIRHVQDEEYFAWRFENPLSNYRFFFWRDMCLDGYLVLRASVLPWRPEVSIVDLEAASEKVLSGLLEAAVAVMAPRPLRVWSASFGETERKVLARLGFKPIKAGITSNARIAMVRPVRDEMLRQPWLLDNLRLLDMQNWNLQMISSDGS